METIIKYKGKEMTNFGNSPLCQDSKIHHNNLINNILLKIEANNAGVDDAIMLDLYGFVAETNFICYICAMIKKIFR